MDRDDKSRRLLDWKRPSRGLVINHRTARMLPSPCSIKLRLRLLAPEETLRDKGRRHRSRWQRDKMMLVPLRRRQERQNNCNGSKESGHRSQKPLELCSCTDEPLDFGTCLETKAFNYALSGHSTQLTHGQYIHAEEISTVNMSTSNSFSRLVPNRPSHLS